MKHICKEIAQSFLESVKRQKKIYLFCGLFVVFGILLGIILSFVSGNLDDFLSLSDKNYMSYLKGSADLSILFFDNFSHVLIASIMCVLLSLNAATVVLALGYLMYQSTIMILTTASVVVSFGFFGIINALFLVIPFNFALVISFAVQIATMFSFCSYNKVSRKMIFDSSLDKWWWIRLLMITLFQIVLCLIMSYFVPFLLKSIIIVSF